MELTLKRFEEMNLYSNKTLEKVISSLVNESSNAVLVNMYEDAVLLLDHKNGQFYLADYSFEPEKSLFTFENFEPITLTKNSHEFVTEAKNYFESEDDGDLNSLVESYSNEVSNQEGFISDLITEAMIRKDFSTVVDYEEAANMNEDVDLSENTTFINYKKRLSTNPLTSIKFFNWKEPVRVSLVESENNSKAIRANDSIHEIWKEKEFKESFYGACETFVEDVEEGTEKFKALLEEYPQLFYLDSADRKTLFGKAIITNSILRENRNDLLKGINLLFEKFDLADMKEDYISEGIIVKGIEGDAATDTEEEEEKAPEADEVDVKEIAKELEKITEKVTDEKLKEKLEELIDKLNGSADTETVKEAVEILSI